MNDSGTNGSICAKAVPSEAKRDLAKLAAAYERADAYNRPPIEFVLRQQHGHYTATGE